MATISLQQDAAVNFIFKKRSVLAVHVFYQLVGIHREKTSSWPKVAKRAIKF